MTRFGKTLVAMLSLVAVAGAARAAGDGFGDLMEEQSEIQAAKTRLVEEKRELEGVRQKMDAVGDQLVQEGADLEQRAAAFQADAAPVYAEVDRFNSQCYGELPEAQYNSCVSWRGTLQPQLDSVNARGEALAGEATVLQGRAREYASSEARLAQAEADWNSRAGHLEAQERAWQLRVAGYRVQRIAEIVEACSSDDVEKKAHCLDRIFDGRSAETACMGYGEDVQGLKACLDSLKS
jgi:uncharacterized protein (DUF3084 family)